MLPSGHSIGPALTGGVLNSISPLPPPNPTTYYAFDPSGNVVQRLNDSGSVVNAQMYAAYGSTVWQGSQAPDCFGFGGQAGYYGDSETGLILCGYRYYDAGLGRWLTRDPAGYKGGVNLYAYCDNNPINNLDPMGLDDDDDDSPVDSKGRAKVYRQAMKKVHQGAVVVNNGLQTAADQFPGMGLAKAAYGKDNAGKKLSMKRRFFEGVIGLATLIPALPKFNSVGGSALEEEVATWLGRKGAKVITAAPGGKDIPYEAIINGQRLVGRYDIEIGRTLIQVKGEIPAKGIAMAQQQIATQAKVAGALGRPFRVFIKEKAHPDLFKWMIKKGIRFVVLK